MINKNKFHIVLKMYLLQEEKLSLYYGKISGGGQVAKCWKSLNCRSVESRLLVVIFHWPH
jgi:hypothetical protein